MALSTEARILQGLFRLGEATEAQLTAFSGASGEDVASCLERRTDVARKDAAGRWAMSAEGREVVRAELRDHHREAGVPPEHMDRLRANVREMESLLAEPGIEDDGGTWDYAIMRIAALTKAFRSAEEGGEDCGAEIARLRGCRDKLEVLSARG